jgi:RNA polymerase sigma factor (sigma-70 family)
MDAGVMMEGIATMGAVKARGKRAGPATVRPGATAGANQTAGAKSHEDTFREAYETHYTKIFAFVYSRVREVELARDVVSEVFERAYVSGNTVRDPNAYPAWLFMVAKNAISAHFRRLKRELSHMDRARNELHFMDGPVQPEAHVLRNERISQLMEQVRTLPQRDQELISLKFDAELSHEEIGRIMNITSVNARVSIFRALKKLKARMESEMAAQ